MPRNMGFSLTTEQVRNKTKTVTRRLNWDHLKEGEIVNACVKAMGFKKGEKVERICQIRIVSKRREPLIRMQRDSHYGAREARLEGFPEMTGSEFVEMFCKHMKCDAEFSPNRIEFEYLSGVK